MKVCEKCCCFAMPVEVRVKKKKNTSKQALLLKPKSFPLFHIQEEEKLKTAFGKMPHSLSSMSKCLLYSLSLHFIS